MTNAITPLLYDRQGAADVLSVSLRQIDYLLSSGTISSRRIGRKRLIEHDELIRYAKMLPAS